MICLILFIRCHILPNTLYSIHSKNLVSEWKGIYSTKPFFNSGVDI